MKIRTTVNASGMPPTLTPRRYGRRIAERFAMLAAAAIVVAFSATTAYADGYVTMHGAACKALAPSSSSVTFGNELWTNSSAANILCPLVTQWGDNGETPVTITGVKMYFGSWGTIACSLYRHSGLWGNQNTGIAATATGSGWNKLLTFADPARVPGLENNNYFIQCSLPAGTALYNIVYKSSTH